MALVVRCQSCQAAFQAQPSLAGKQVKCPRCETPIQVPNVIPVACSNGHRFAAPVGLAGKTLNCPSCGVALHVPIAGVASSQPQPTNQNDWFGDALSDQERQAMQSPTAQHPISPQVSPTPSDESKLATFLGQRVEADISIPRTNLENIRLGLKIKFFQVVTLLVANAMGSIGIGAVAFSVGANVALGGKSEGVGATMIGVSSIPLLVSILLYFVLPFIDVTGTIFCLWLPTENHCRTAMISTLALKIAIPLVLFVLTVMKVWPVYSVLFAGVGSLAAWLLFMLSLSRFGEFLQRHEFVEEASRIVTLGLGTLLAAMAVPGVVAALLVNRQFYWLIAFFFVGGVAGQLLFRANPLAFVTNVFYYGTGVGFVIEYANFLGSLQGIRVKVR